MAISRAEREFCTQVELFRGVSADAITALIDGAERMLVDPETLIVREGDSGSDMFILVEGSVRISKHITLHHHSDDDVSKDLTILTADQFAHFGEMGLLEEDERTATVAALTGCTLLKISKDRFDAFAAAHPADAYTITRNMARVLSSRLRKANKDIVKLTTVLGVALGKGRKER